MSLLKKLYPLTLLAILIGALTVSSCYAEDLSSEKDTEISDTAQTDSSKEVIIYTSIEQPYCEKIFQNFEEDTGIKVQAVYDTEANKTTGLVNRIVAESEHPICDVFWNNEFVQTIDLQEKGLLAPYFSPNAETVSESFKDKEGYWTAIGGRARVFLINKDLIENVPAGMMDLVDDTYRGQDIAIAYPMFGTTRTQAAAMYAYYGEEKARKYYQDLADKKVNVVDGNIVTPKLSRP